MSLLNSLFFLAIAVDTTAAMYQEPLAAIQSLHGKTPNEEHAGAYTLPPFLSTSGQPAFEMFPLTGTRCLVDGVNTTWPRQLLTDGGVEYIQKHKMGTADPNMIESVDPRGQDISPAFRDAFEQRCTKTENIRAFYMV